MEKKDFPKGTKPREIFVYTCERIAEPLTPLGYKYRKSKNDIYKKDGIFVFSFYFSPSIRFGSTTFTAFFDVSSPVIAQWRSEQEGTADTQVLDAEIREAFLRLYYNLKIHGEVILSEMLTSLQTIRNRRMLWSLDIIELNKQISELTSQNQMLATLKQQGLIDPDIFISQNNELTEQLRTVKLKKERLLVADGDSTITQTRELMEILDAGPDFLDCFDAELFGELVEKIIVDSNVQLRFRLKNGLELVEAIERTVR